MSYTKETIVSDSHAPVPNQPPMVEREFDPYKKHVTPAEIARNRALEAAQSGQVDKDGIAKPDEPKATDDTVKLSPQVAALARKEQKFRQEQQALKADKDALEKEKAEVAELKALKAKLAAKDYSGLDGLVKYEDYSQYQLDKLNGADPNKEALKAIQDELSTLKKSQEDNISKQFDAAVAERRTAAKALVASSDEFTTIRELKMEEAVVQHILDTWEHDNKELSVEDAAKEVESELVERAKRWSSVTKLKPAEPPVEEKKQLPPLSKSPKTLTNQVTSGDFKKPSKPLHLMSESERYAEARRRAVEKMGLNQRG